MAQIELNNLSLLLNEIGGEVVDRFKKSMDRPFKHRNGKTYNTVASGKTKDSAKYTLLIDDSARLTFEVDDKYNEIKKGRNPGKFSKVQPLKQWFIDRRLSSGDEKQDKQSIRRINYAIYREGIEPKPFLDLVTIGKTINSAIDSAMGDLALNLSEYRDDILKAVTKDIVQYLKQI